MGTYLAKVPNAHRHSLMALPSLHSFFLVTASGYPGLATPMPGAHGLGLVEVFQARRHLQAPLLNVEHHLLPAIAVGLGSLPIPSPVLESQSATFSTEECEHLP